MSLPKFLYSKAENVPSAGEYIIHTRTPHCVGKIEMDGDKVRVIMHETWDEMHVLTQKGMCLEMKNWYYFKYIYHS